MATIEQLLGASTQSLEAMTDEQLKEYLKEIINLEPTPLPIPLGTKLKNTIEEEEDSNNPIKSLKKQPSKLKKLKLNPKDVLDNLKKELDEL